MGRIRSLLRPRSLGEIRERAAQEAAKRSERMGWRDSAEPGDTQLFQWLGTIRSAGDWRAHIAERTAPVFFRGFADAAATARAIRAMDPEYAKRCVARADAALGGRFDLLGYRALEFGWPIDWHRDPVHGVRAPLRHWSAIPYLDARVAGDHKVVWELNRLQWLTDLGAAWWMTDDARYANAMVHALTQWMDANPPKRGVNWASSLEVAFRAISCVWALEFLRRSDALDAATLARLTKYLVLHGRHLERYLSTYFSPNTHLTGEALGLYYLGTYLPELEQGARWKEMGVAVLMDQLPRHVLHDGVYFEQSVHYQRYTIDFFTHLWLLDQENGGTLSVEIAPQLEAMLEYVQCLTRGDGSVPLFGDEDGGRLFFLDGRPLNDLRGTLAIGAVLCDRPDFAYISGAPTAELVWLAGPEAVDRFQALGKAEPRYASRGFDEGGVYVMRDGWDNTANHCVIDCGPHGTLNCGHAHADVLAFELAVHGRPVFVDPGTFSYTTSPEDRDAFRSTMAHNAASVDGAGSSEPDGPFHWRRIAAARALEWRVSNDGRATFFSGSHDGFERLPSPAKYRRTVDFRKQDDRLIVVRDSFSCRTEHTGVLTFQCAPEIELVRLTATSLDCVRDGVVVCRLETTGGNGAFEVEDAWVSRCYGARERAPRCRFVTALRPGVTELTTTITLAPHDTSAPAAGDHALTESR